MSSLPNNSATTRN